VITDVEYPEPRIAFYKNLLKGKNSTGVRVKRAEFPEEMFRPGGTDRESSSILPDGRICQERLQGQGPDLSKGADWRPLCGTKISFNYEGT